MAPRGGAWDDLIMADAFEKDMARIKEIALLGTAAALSIAISDALYDWRHRPEALRRIAAASKGTNSQ